MDSPEGRFAARTITHCRHICNENGEIDRLLEYVQNGSVTTAIAKALNRDVQNVTREEFVDQNGSINCVIGKMRYIEFGDWHHIRINEKMFTIEVNQYADGHSVMSASQQSYQSGLSDRTFFCIYKLIIKGQCSQRNV